MQVLFFLAGQSYADEGYCPGQGQTPDVSSVCEAPKSGDSPSALRGKYVCEIERYLPVVDLALQDTETKEGERAKTLNDLRRSIGKKYKDLTPEWLQGFIYCRNEVRYQDVLGPTYDSLKKKGKSDAEIIKSSVRTGGQDLLLDSSTGKTMINYANEYGIGPAINMLWSWMPGKSCPEAMSKGNKNEKKDDKHTHEKTSHPK
ncbi:MAG: hypothetical protein KA436_09140 [Oligoflexales bacterium]|nr:hypothetical protein [Oligoflexales bacterium]